jgi:predicted DNA-binding transcriptional regulator YafY
MRLDKIYKAHQILKTARYPVPMKRFQESLAEGLKKVSRTTVDRVFKDMREKYFAPLDYVTRDDRKGWIYTDEQYELPGLWFNAEELASLLFMEQMLEQLQTGPLVDNLQRFKVKIKELLGKDMENVEAISARIRLLPAASRKTQYERFPQVASALLQRRKLKIDYYARGRNETNNRVVSPQRLILYRDNWYLDAYCHWRMGLRSFAIDCIETAALLDESSLLLDESEVDRQLRESYGIFGSPVSDWAVLRFNAVQARWVRQEIWHPKQEGRLLDDGRFELRVPFGNPTELIRDILKFGCGVEVVGPENLRMEVANQLQQALKQYENLQPAAFTHG